MLAIVASDKKYVAKFLDNFRYEKLEATKYSSYYKVSYQDHEFMVITTGYGKINVASSLMHAKDNYNVNTVLLVGTAGSINENCNIFDIVIPNLSLEFDVDFMPNGYEAGQIPQLNSPVYYTNEDLSNCLKEVCDEVNHNYYTTPIASSDMFVCNYRLAQSIRNEYDASFVDVEAGSLGQFCSLNNIEYACVKVTSNYASNNGLRQYNAYDDRANVISQEIAKAFIMKFYE